MQAVKRVTHTVRRHIVSKIGVSEEYSTHFDSCPPYYCKPFFNRESVREGAFNGVET
jgi:hypothetical protein